MTVSDIKHDIQYNIIMVLASSVASAVILLQISCLYVKVNLKNCHR